MFFYVVWEVLNSIINNNLFSGANDTLEKYLLLLFEDSNVETKLAFRIDFDSKKDSFSTSIGRFGTELFSLWRNLVAFQLVARAFSRCHAW